LLAIAVLHHEGALGLDEVAIVLFLLIMALIALYLALQMPRLSEYQPDDDGPAGRR